MNKCKRILCLLDGEEQIIIGTIRDTGEWSIGAGEDIAEIIERDTEETIRISWLAVLEVSDMPDRCPSCASVLDDTAGHSVRIVSGQYVCRWCYDRLPAQAQYAKAVGGAQ